MEVLNLSKNRILKRSYLAALLSEEFFQNQLLGGISEGFATSSVTLSGSLKGE